MLRIQAVPLPSATLSALQQALNLRNECTGQQLLALSMASAHERTSLRPSQSDTTVFSRLNDDLLLEIFAHTDLQDRWTEPMLH